MAHFLVFFLKNDPESRRVTDFNVTFLLLLLLPETEEAAGRAEEVPEAHPRGAGEGEDHGKEADAGGKEGVS